MEAESAPQKLSPALLRRIPLFAGLDESRLASLAEIMWVKTFARRDVVVTKGSSGEALMILLFGRLQAMDITEEGREVGLNLIPPGAFFGELAVIDGLPRSAFVVALASSGVAFLPRAVALDLFYHEPTVAAGMYRHLARSIRQLSNMRLMLGKQNAFQRVFALLASLMREAPGGVHVIEGLPTHQEISIMINTSRETVSRALAELQQQGVLEKDVSRMIVREPAKLQRLAGLLAPAKAAP
ncbi:MAG: Crp/Fnr family transcriptional regulator [Rhodocyclaceae bacterium]|jgi:CRP-like cAMP-binding protein|nr:Crp/Fnr family transcriptional regulator [Rhodocyclaceae bacterium]